MLYGYKLLRKMKDGTLAPLFINKKQRIPLGVWLDAESHPTKGYAVRPGWHGCLDTEDAPHLSKQGRVWCAVMFDDYMRIDRPASQGGQWVLANRMKVLEVLDDEEESEG